MRDVLVDTHIALWALSESRKLTESERHVLADRERGRWLSPVSLWEAALKRESGKLIAPANLAAELAEDYRFLELDAMLLEAAAELPLHHRDPFDRVLVAHALRDDLEILTRDAIFGSYGVKLAA